VIRRQQLEDEVDRRKVGLYRRYAVLAMHPYLNRTANRLERVAKAYAPGRKPRAGEEVFTLSSAHDVTVAPLLSALGLEEALFPRFAARVVFELWKSPHATQGPRKGQRQSQNKASGVKGERSKGGNMFVRVLYNGEDVTFHTTFCRSHDRHATQPLCPLGNFLSFVRKDMFDVLNATSYHDACFRRTG
jgi:hypothetical protein